MKNIVKYLRRSKEVDLTQQGFADAIGVSRATIANIESGSTPSSEVMIKIANYFEKDPRDIFFTDDVAHVLQSKDKQEVS